MPELGYSRSSLRLRSSRRCVKLHGRSRTNPGATAPPVSGTGDARLQAHAPIHAFLAHALPTARLALRTPLQPPCLLGALRSRAPLTRLTAWTDTAWGPSDPQLNNRKNTLINAGTTRPPLHLKEHCSLVSIRNSS